MHNDLPDAQTLTREAVHEWFQFIPFRGLTGLIYESHRAAFRHKEFTKSEMPTFKDRINEISIFTLTTKKKKKQQ